ncbi:cyclase family protein [Saliphagus sp. GCM10025308]
MQAAEGEVQAGDTVVLYTGWYHKYGDDDYDPYPWLAPEVADWLLEKEAGMLCVDTVSPDISYSIRPDDWDEYPIHKPLLQNDVLIAEHLTNLEPLLGERIEIRAYPSKIRGGDGAPARIVARPI